MNCEFSNIIKSGEWWSAIILFLGIASVGLPATVEADSALWIQIDLRDGSRVLGEPKFNSTRLKTTYATLDLPLANIRKIEFTELVDRATCLLRNDDKISGIPMDTKFTIESSFGMLTFQLRHVQRFEVRTTEKGSNLPPGEGSLLFGGVNLTPFLFLFEVRDGVLASLPKPRPGFKYGHSGHGRGARVYTNRSAPEFVGDDG